VSCDDNCNYYREHDGNEEPAESFIIAPSSTKSNEKPHVTPFDWFKKPATQKWLASENQKEASESRCVAAHSSLSNNIWSHK
jgi:hypothetical protein